jgi:exodeoxyribonuclease V alpha subunit
MLALIEEQSFALGKAAPRIALAAPTGKAAARLAEAVQLEASRLDVGPATSSGLANVEASTVHRLLGWRRDTASRFRHNRYNRLPHDVVVVDEASMLSLSMMSRLLEALRPDARLTLVGDPGQLASVEAGAVLGDLVGPATSFVPCGLPHAQAQGSVQGQCSAPSERSAGRLADVIVVLRQVHRFGGGIAELAEAAGRGDADAVVNLLRAGSDDLRWLASTGEAATYEASIRPEVLEANRSLTQWACEGRLDRALAALSSLGVLCAYRHGPSGARSWNERIARWLAEDIPGRAGSDRWYPGRPLLITENDYDLGLYNGDTGVVATGRDGQLTAVFDRPPSHGEVAPARLRAVETVHAMTVHKSQGSQFDEVILVLPEVDGPLLSRELLYTALTRARRRVSVIGPEAVLRAALDRPIARASGLRERLWSSARGTE